MSEYFKSPVRFAQALQFWKESLIGSEYYDPQNPHMIQVQQAKDSEIKSFRKNLDLSAPGTMLWSDLKDGHREYRFMHSFYRLDKMAQAHENPASTYYKNKELLEEILASLTYLNKNHYYKEGPNFGNWWCYEIGSPLAINNILTCLYQDVPETLRLSLLDAIRYYVPDPFYMVTHFGFGPIRCQGGNQVDIAKVCLVTSLLSEDEAGVLSAWQALQSVFTLVTDGNGFYPDYSYIDHGNVAYPGGYGAVFLEGLSQVLPLTSFIGLNLKKQEQNLLYEWILQSFLPFIVKGELMDMIRGRSATRKAFEPHVAGVDILLSILRLTYLTQFSSEAKTELKKILKYQLSEEKFLDITSLAKDYHTLYLVKALKDDSNVPLEKPTSFAYWYPAMVKFVAHSARYDFTLGVSLHAPNIQNYESINTENKKGWYTSDGMTYIYNGDLGHYSEDFQPTIDPKRRPGTTVLQEDRPDSWGQTVLSRNFSFGRVDDRQNVVMAMDFVNADRSLSAHKAWFYFQDKLLCLGAGIQKLRPSDRPVETVVLNRKISGKSFVLTINGQNLDIKEGETKILTIEDHLFLSVGPKSHPPKNTFGISFYEPTSIYVKLDRRQANWQDINDMEKNLSAENLFLTIWIEHDADKTSYAYGIYPNRTYVGFLDEIKEGALEVRENGVLRQTAYDPKQRLLAGVNYDYLSSDTEPTFFL